MPPGIVSRRQRPAMARAWMPEVEQRRSSCRMAGPAPRTRDGCCPSPKRSPIRGIVSRRQRPAMARAWMPEVEQCRSNCRMRGPATHRDVQVSREAGCRERPPRTRDGCCPSPKRSPIRGIVSRRQRPAMGETCRFRHASNRMSRQVERPRGCAGRMRCTRDGVCLTPEQGPGRIACPDKSNARADARAGRPAPGTVSTSLLNAVRRIRVPTTLIRPFGSVSRRAGEGNCSVR